MTLPSPPTDGDDLLRNRVTEDQNRLYGALKLLFDLLEDYGPLWYTAQHHNKAKAALLAHERASNKGHRDSKMAA
jgi:hypothetical protein